MLFCVTGKPGTGSKTVVTQQGQNMRTGTLTGSSRIIAGNHMSVDTADASPFSQKKSLTDVSNILISQSINQFVLFYVFALTYQNLF